MNTYNGSPFNGGPFGGFNMFNFMSVIFPIVFVIVLAVILINVIRGLAQWNHNNHQPVLSVPALVVSKRTQVSHHHHQAHNSDMNHGMHSYSSTSYYVTFQVESGDRMELHVPAAEFGMLAEGDSGKLTFQGTRFCQFERNIAG